jgi:hypothetical protein
MIWLIFKFENRYTSINKKRTSTFLYADDRSEHFVVISKFFGSLLIDISYFREIQIKIFRTLFSRARLLGVLV